MHIPKRLLNADHVSGADYNTITHLFNKYDKETQRDMIEFTEAIVAHLERNRGVEYFKEPLKRKAS